MRSSHLSSFSIRLAAQLWESIRMETEGRSNVINFLRKNGKICIRNLERYTWQTFDACVLLFDLETF